MAEAIILIGLQGAGKTTYFNQHFAATHEHISRDVQKSFDRELAMMRDCLTTGRSFVIDDTNATRDSRAPFVHEPKAAGFKVIAYFFDTPVRTAIGRNNHRKDKKPIPVPAVLRTAKTLQSPEATEGFDEVHFVKPEKSAA